MSLPPTADNEWLWDGGVDGRSSGHLASANECECPDQALGHCAERGPKLGQKTTSSIRTKLRDLADCISRVHPCESAESGRRHLGSRQRIASRHLWKQSSFRRVADRLALSWNILGWLDDQTKRAHR